MTEPDVDMTPATVADIVGDLEDFSRNLRGIVVLTVEHSGTGRIAMGGAVTVPELQAMIRILIALEHNSVQINKLMSMEPEGHA